MKKRIAIITLVVATVAVAAAVPILHARPGGRGMHGGPGMHHGFGHGQGLAILGHLAKVGEELDLTVAQKEQIHAIVKETREQNAGFREQLHGTMKNVAQTLIANPNDVAGAQAILDNQAAAEKALKTNMLNAASKALNVLTPAQRTKLAEIMAEHVERMESRRK